MRAALDTNVLVYAEGLHGPVLKQAALELVVSLSKPVAVIPVQVLGELYRVLVGKAGRSRESAHTSLLSWRDSFQLVDTSEQVMLDAVDLASAHQLNIWDAVIVCSAARAGCRLLLSEDLAEGFTWNGVTVTNPFAKTKNGLLESLLNNPKRT